MTRRGGKFIALGAAVVLGGAALFVAITGIADSMELARVRRHAAEAPTGEEIAAARHAIESLATLEAQPTWRHVWLRTLGKSSYTDAVSTAAEALADAEAVTSARAENVSWLNLTKDRIVQATTLPALDALRAAVAKGPPSDRVPLQKSALIVLTESIDETAKRFADDDAANAQAIEAARAALETAGTDPAALYAVVERVLPRPDRNPAVRTPALEALRASAHARRVLELIERVQTREMNAMKAPSSAQVRVELTALESDPDMRRGVPASVGLDGARERMAARARALDAWERGRKWIEAALEAGDPVSAAHAMAALRAPDGAQAKELADLRAGFGARAGMSLTKALVRLAERSDWKGARRLIAALHADPTVAALLDEDARIALERSERSVQDLEDRSLYDEFRNSPRTELAQRYMEGWPGVPRRMASVVSEYLHWSATPRTQLWLIAVEWYEVGTSTSPIADMPDASIEVKVNGTTHALTKIADVRSRTRSTLVKPIAIPLSEDDSRTIALDCTVSIDLRGVSLADPVATGHLDVSPAEARSRRFLVAPASDPEWNTRPHRLVFAVEGVGAPVLPPWDSAGSAPSR